MRLTQNNLSEIEVLFPFPCEIRDREATPWSSTVAESMLLPSQHVLFILKINSRSSMVVKAPAIVYLLCQLEDVRILHCLSSGGSLSFSRIFVHLFW